MRRITTWLLSTVSALVLLFSYHTSTGQGATTVALGDANADGAAAPDTASGDGTSSGSSDGSSSSSSSSSDSSSATPSPSTTKKSSSSAAKTYTGDAIQTRYGPVQVEITVKGGRITKSAVTQVPWSDHRDQEINGYAVPILNDEAVQAQDAGIDMVSGATFTSDGYIQSLQSAIDQANL
ncbi:FMN-binding protein [Phycicoccus sp. MAQZ13P-2]|uniref:FMN-binding protein n=1 Tax=Phycicoccus mangrovi TaxID=2840470 RepID=UPI001BFFF4B8|nr:FMN-binding protein [Phycicoccus mangrovi]MBT9254419.1 FMN-binding protein [Phycicoccus mangrovi]MBT9272797.1 FMN-binding protein [Phycicoccus mangrovi]